MKCKGHKTNGEPCTRWALVGREHCPKHGGKTPIGAQHWNYQGKGRSKHVPTYLSDLHAEAEADDKLMEYRQDAVLLEARLRGLLKSGESQQLWGAAQEAFGDYKKAALKARYAEKGSVEQQQAGDQMAEALGALESLISRGMADSLRWREIYGTLEQIGKTKEREHRRLVQAEAMISAEQFMTMLGQIALAAKQHISNQDEFKAFTNTINRFGLVNTDQLTDGGH